MHGLMKSTSDVTKTNILGYTRETLRAKLAEMAIKPFIADQILDWIYKKFKLDFSDMVNIAKETRARLDEVFEIRFFKNIETLESDGGRATKMIITLNDGKYIEAVVLREKKYNTLCVSSQCGCPVDCKFCLTGVAGFKRNLESYEIVGQILLANQLGHPISNLVFMGMGEPLLNYDNVFEAINLMNAEYSFHISKRKMTVSTSGYIQNIKRLISEKNYINLAFSVGHANPSKRVVLMPIEARNPIMEIVALLHEYQTMHNRKLTLEYTLIQDKNEDDQAIRELSNISKYLNAKINLINLNPHPKIPFRPVTTKRLHEVRDLLENSGVPVTIRFRKGDDISAACGQLGESCLG